MSSSDGFISCKGFTYNVYNIKLVRTNNENEENRIKLGTIIGKLGAQIKIECLFGTPTTEGPVVLTMYGSFNNNTTDYQYNNFKGYYTIIGKNINTTEHIYIIIESNEDINNPNMNYSVYFFPIYPTELDITLNYFVYLPNNCTWVHDGNSYYKYGIDEEPHVHNYYQRLI